MGLLLNVVVLVAASVQLERNFERGTASAAAGAEAVLVQQLGSRVLSDLVDAETGQRGYLLTQDEDYLRPYVTATLVVGQHLEQLAGVAATSAERAMVADIHERALAKLETISASLAVLEAEGPDAAAELVSQDEGRLLMDNIRLDVTALAENSLSRAARSAATADDYEQLTRSMLLFTALFLGASLLLMVVLLRQRGRWEHQRYRMLDEMRALATRDPLTGLLNRRLLEDRLQHAVGQALRRGGDVSVAFIDLNGFKAVNDALGHHAGDLVLVDIANRLQGVLRDSDTLARVGGDEFVVVIEGLPAHQSVKGIVQRLVAATTFTLPRPPGADTDVLAISASIGLVSLAELQEDPSADPDAVASRILAAADQSMYEQKNRARTGADR